MRKLIILAVSLVALVAVIATPFANAASVDANGVVTVTKGDIQSAMGWNNAGWDTYLSTHTVADMGKLITVGSGPAPSAPDGGMLYLNGQTGIVTADYIADPENWTSQFDWTPRAQTITPEPVAASVQPIVNAQNKLTGFKVSSTGTVSWTVHTTYAWIYVEGKTFTRNTTIQWPASGGVSDIKVNGKPITVTPAA